MPTGTVINVRTREGGQSKPVVTACIKIEATREAVCVRQMSNCDFQWDIWIFDLFLKKRKKSK